MSKRSSASKENMYPDNHVLCPVLGDEDKILLVHQLCDQNLGFVNFFEEAKELVEHHQCPGSPVQKEK